MASPPRCRRKSEKKAKKDESKRKVGKKNIFWWQTPPLPCWWQNCWGNLFSKSSQSSLSRFDQIRQNFDTTEKQEEYKWRDNSNIANICPKHFPTAGTLYKFWVQKTQKNSKFRYIKNSWLVFVHFLFKTLRRDPGTKKTVIFNKVSSTNK